jgi:hypothetical protein
MVPTAEALAVGPHVGEHANPSKSLCCHRQEAAYGVALLLGPNLHAPAACTCGKCGIHLAF